jgi:hypothetical protein
VLPEPALSLAAFNFNRFNKFCNDRGLVQLIQRSRGIFPEIDSLKTQPLQFLPFYEETLSEEPFIMGNYNWKLARTLMGNALNEEL